MKYFAINEFQATRILKYLTTTKQPFEEVVEMIQDLQQLTPINLETPEVKTNG